MDEQQLLTDPREMRQTIEKLRFGRSDIHGKELDLMKVPMTASLVWNCIEHARHAGLSGEDLYTLIAYHALLMVESMGTQLLENANYSIRPAFQVPQKSNADKKSS